MSNPFAAVETALNATLHAAFSNATAEIAGESIDGILDDRYISPLGIAASGPVFSCPTPDAELAYGDTITVRTATSSTTYTVRAIETDGTGRTLLTLESA